MSRMSPGVGGKERQATPSHGQTLIHWFLSTTQRTSILMPCLGHHPSLAPLLYSLEGQYSFLDVPSHLTHMPPEWSFQPSDLTTRAQDYCKIKATCPMCSVPSSLGRHAAISCLRASTNSRGQQRTKSYLQAKIGFYVCGGF